ncbi:MAG: RIP metalloprotease RseP [candidate division NC10 bacterium]|nr:RIP metalloprotease RseP [candidate division NC10 bacterium]
MTFQQLFSWNALALWDHAQTFGWYLWWFALVIGALIFVHELGHFLLAKRAGVGVLKFSLGFGPKLFGFRRNETEYLISAIPLGGYVKMIGEDPREEGAEGDRERSFAEKPVGTRALIIAAGPLSNFLLAFVIFLGLFAFVGRPASWTVIGRPEADSSLAQAGLKAGDRIVAVEGQAVSTWEELEGKIQASQGQPLRLTVEREGRRFEASIIPRRVAVKDIFGGEKEAWDIGSGPFISTKIGQVMKGHPADQAGLQPGDRILAFQGQPVEGWDELAALIHAHPGEKVKLLVERGGKSLEVEVVPRPTEQGGKKIGLIGIAPAQEFIYQRTDPFTGFYLAGKRTVELTGLILYSLVKLIQGEIPASTLGGPVLVGQMAGEQAKAGFLNVLLLTAGLSINLGILNLLPIPVLDGGHLFFALIEAIRGRPLKVRTREIANYVGLALLVALMLYATRNDIMRLIGPQ